jgi:hypothetical protein
MHDTIVKRMCKQFNEVSSDFPPPAVHLRDIVFVAEAMHNCTPPFFI